MGPIERAKFIERSINEMRRMINVIVNGRGYYYSWNRTMSDDEKLRFCKDKLERLIQEYQKL